MLSRMTSNKSFVLLPYAAEQHWFQISQPLCHSCEFYNAYLIYLEYMVHDKSNVYHIKLNLFLNAISDIIYN